MALRVVVVGGGVAGLATAWSLARRKHRVTLVEREAAPGAHASGRNAGLVRQVVTDPVLLELGRRGTLAMLSPPSDLSARPLAERTGSVLLAGEREGPALEAAARAARAAGVECVVEVARAAIAPGFTPAPGMLAVRTASDALAEPTTVICALAVAARTAGVEVRLGRDADLVVARGRVEAVSVDGVALPCDVAVNAAGPWAAQLAGAAGGVRVPLSSLRRHLFLADLAGPPRWPWVWDVERGLYARPWHGGRVLLCACDEEPRPPEDAQVEPEARDALARKVARVAPALQGLAPREAWAGLRTFAPDRRFLVGWDPNVSALYWVAGLGGHGLTSGLAVGDLAARAIDDRAQDDAALLAALSPARFAPTAVGTST